MPPKQPINIKPSHEGKFGDWAKTHGFKTTQEAASAVMANKGKYDPAVVKMANFAHNAAGFKHSKPALSKLMGK